MSFCLAKGGRAALPSQSAYPAFSSISQLWPERPLFLYPSPLCSLEIRAARDSRIPSSASLRHPGCTLICLGSFVSLCCAVCCSLVSGTTKV
ncbi:hypothetical protein BCV70DRAFT_75569 [Testicularia cyperi]|uniref:Uncharacterized protein n=1 Tax=Testicularia cyperi TaxID=1882483 RepID=A0A317XTY9_9BASI|nr:hypothetical protein BCV70DRAFT_75569 [Testicularia cyperi]